MIIFEPTFLTSMFIILREGFEMLLLCSLMFMSVARKPFPFNSTQTLSVQRARNYMWVGIFSAILFSIGLGIAAHTILSHDQEELYEIIIHLSASAMLFYISIWCHGASTHLDEFKNIITRGTAIALAFTVFVIIAREGFEIVLFYAALLSADHTTGVDLAAWGAVAGGILLLGVHILMQRGSKKLPISQCFGVASIVLFIFAIYFLLGGLHEFAEYNQIHWMHEPLKFMHKE